MAKGPQRSVVLLSFLPKREVSCSIEAGHSPVVASLCTPGVHNSSELNRLAVQCAHLQNVKLPRLSVVLVCLAARG